MPTLINGIARYGNANKKAWREQAARYQAILDDPESSDMDRINAGYRLKALKKRIAAHS